MHVLQNIIYEISIQELLCVTNPERNKQTKKENKNKIIKIKKNNIGLQMVDPAIMRQRQCFLINRKCW